MLSWVTHWINENRWVIIWIHFNRLLLHSGSVVEADPHKFKAGGQHLCTWKFGGGYGTNVAFQKNQDFSLLGGKTPKSTICLSFWGKQSCSWNLNHRCICNAPRERRLYSACGNCWVMLGYWGRPNGQLSQIRLWIIMLPVWPWDIRAYPIFRDTHVDCSMVTPSIQPPHRWGDTGDSPHRRSWDASCQNALIHPDPMDLEASNCWAPPTGPTGHQRLRPPGEAPADAKSLFEAKDIYLYDC